MKTFSRSLLASGFVALAIVSSAAASPGATPTPESSHRMQMQSSETQALRGRIKSFDAATGALVVESWRQGSETNTTVYIKPSTTLTLDGATVTADRLAVGQHVAIETGATKDGHLECTSVKSRSMHMASMMKPKREG